MQRIQRILVGVDLHHGDRIATDDWGPATQAALDQAVQVASATGASITLCSVLELTVEAQHFVEYDPHHLRKSVEDVAQAALQKLAEQLSARGVTADFVLRFGSPWEELTRQAIGDSCELVIVGTRARNAAARLLFGSTAQKLIRNCPTPVWVVKPGEVRELREILVATDFSDTSRAALRAGVEIARLLSAKLYVVHAVEYPFEAYLRTSGIAEAEVQKYRHQLAEQAREQAHGQLSQCDYRTLPFGVLVELPEGTPDAVIPQFIVDHEVDLLVIGTHGRTGLGRVLLGNTAERLLPSVHCSLLAIKPPGFECPVSVA